MTAVTESTQGSAERPEGVPPDAPETLDRAVKGERLDFEEERGVLSFLLGAQKAPRYRVPVKFDTEVGMKELTWIIKALPAEKLDEIEKRNTKDTQPGRMPQMDDQRVAAETVVEATVTIRDPLTGDETNPREERFRRQPDGQIIEDPAEVLKQRFFFQSGTLAALVAEVRQISGWGPDRVGSAQRVIADAAGGS
jgi:hypothetical protein